MKKKRAGRAELFKDSQGRRNEGEKETKIQKKRETQLVSAITHLFAEFARYFFSFSIVLPRIIHRASYMNPRAWTRNCASMLMKVMMQVRRWMPMPERRMLSMMRGRRVLLQMLLLLLLQLSTITSMTIPTTTTLRGGGSDCTALGMSGTIWKGKYTRLWWHLRSSRSSVYHWEHENA